MLDDVLTSAIEQAEHAKAPVRAAAILRISCVETATNPSAARNTFDRGVDAVRRLPGIEGAFLLEQAALIAAAVAPDLLNGTSKLVPPHLFGHTLIEVMLDHGHLEQAAAHLMDSQDTPEFPFGMVQVVMWRLSEKSLKLSLLRRAVEAWRHSPPYDSMSPNDDGFIHLFQREWNLLPETEARTLARDIVQLTTGQPEQPMTASYADAVEITSWRAYVFFQILHALRRRDPDLADSLIAKNAQLAKAARRFPKGLESIEEEAESRRRQLPPSDKPGLTMRIRSILTCSR
jgi:hypothetical protein